jgi:hypothetical protein
MSDSLIALGVIAIIIGGYLFLRNRGWMEDTLRSPQPEVVATIGKAKTTKLKKKTIGAYAHEISNHRSKQSENRRKNEGATGDFATVESLPSIYQEKFTKRSVKVSSHNSDGTKPKVLYGVPVDAWVRSQANSFGMPVSSDVGDLNVRVFVQCMELKKEGAEALTQTQCKPLQQGLVNIAKRSYDRNTAQ